MPLPTPGTMPFASGTPTGKGALARVATDAPRREEEEEEDERPRPRRRRSRDDDDDDVIVVDRSDAEEEEDARGARRADDDATDDGVADAAPRANAKANIADERRTRLEECARRADDRGGGNVPSWRWRQLRAAVRAGRGGAVAAFIFAEIRGPRASHRGAI
jgi:hypothetical protein